MVTMNGAQTRGGVYRDTNKKPTSEEQYMTLTWQVKDRNPQDDQQRRQEPQE